MFVESQDGDVAIIRQNGVFKQCPLAFHKGQVFAKVGSGYVRLQYDGKTSVPSIQVDEIVTDHQLLRDRHGRLCVEPEEGRTALTETETLCLTNCGE